MTTTKVFETLCLDSTGSDGVTREVSQAVMMNGSNGAQAEFVVLVQTATSLEAQLQVSNDGGNWANKGSAQSISAIGRTVLTPDTSVAAGMVRLEVTLTGAGKAILDAWLSVSSQ